MGGQLLHVHSPEVSTAPLWGPSQGLYAYRRAAGVLAKIQWWPDAQPAAGLPLQPSCEKRPMCGLATGLAKPGMVGGLYLWAWQHPTASGSGGSAPPWHIPCTMQRCGQCRLPAQLCPAVSPGSSHRFPYPGSASTGHTLPMGKRGERASAWLLAGAFGMRNRAVPSKG